MLKKMASYNPELFKRYLSKVNFHPQNYILWMSMALLFKVFFFLSFFHYLTVEPGVLGSVIGDTGSYFSPIESLLETGSYSPDFRMPGYGGVYFLFRLFFSSTAAINIIIVSQWILAAVSSYLLAVAVYNFT